LRALPSNLGIVFSLVCRAASCLYFSRKVPPKNVVFHAPIPLFYEISLFRSALTCSIRLFLRPNAIFPSSSEPNSKFPVRFHCPPPPPEFGCLYGFSMFGDVFGCLAAHHSNFGHVFSDFLGFTELVFPAPQFISWSTPPLFLF